MSSLYFSLCGLFCEFLLIVLFFSKKRINSKETKIYGFMLISSFIDVILVILELLITFYFSTNNSIFIVKVLNKIDFIHYILWPSLMVLYVNFITYKNIYFYEKLKRYVLIFNFIVIIIEFCLPIEIISNNETMGVLGIGTYFVYVIALIYFFILLFMMFTNLKKICQKKYIPIFTLMLFMFFAAFIRIINPTLIVLPSIIVYINMIMYFTIENPDMKLIEELNIAKDNAIKANLAKSDFLSSMSHEIRTPLNAIVGLSEDMRSRNNCPIDMKEDLDDVVSASKTLLEIVGNIMDISKIESDKMEIVDVCYNFKEEVETLARVNATRIGDKQINFNVNIAEDIPYELMGDKIRIKQIINNLLSNAMKYTEKGNIDFSVKCINQDEKCLLIITVKDTGRGIKAENINKLFSKFERLDIEKNSTTEGTGLGLAITKKLVEMMGGTINVESSFGKGSIFIVQIPQKIKSINKPFTEEDIADVGGYLLKNNNFSGKKILIVDDNKLNIKVAKRSLDGFGFIIDECFNGLECLNKIKAGEVYDIILMDIMMPVMSGETAIKELCNISNFSTPVIALTADALVGAEEKYRSIGFVDYISKPFTKEQIKSKLDKILSNNSLKYNPKIDRFAGVEPVIIGNDND